MVYIEQIEAYSEGKMSEIEHISFEHELEDNSCSNCKEAQPVYPKKKRISSLEICSLFIRSTALSKSPPQNIPSDISMLLVMSSGTL